MVYSVTVYDSAPLEGATLEEWTRKFAGPVGKNPGLLESPIQPKVKDGRFVTAIGVYGGPSNTALGALFVGVTVDGAQNIHAARVLFSSQEVLDRYKTSYEALLTAMTKRATREAGNKILSVPSAVTAKIKPGGVLVPGVYAGTKTQNGKVTDRYRVYLYANGESRVTDENDADLKGSYGTILGVGKAKYYQGSGQLDLDSFDEIFNDDDGDKYAFYGRDAAGKATIMTGNKLLNTRITLVYDGQPTKRPSPATMKARAIEDARFKWVTAPSKGVADAQIAAIVNNCIVRFDGMSSKITNDAYLLLKDGTIYNGLPVAPDQLDMAKSRAGEPQKWGKWRAKGGGIEVSWNGNRYETLPGKKAVPAPANAKLSGRFGAVRSYSYGFGGSYSFWGATFTPAGRFKKDNRGGSSTNTAGIEGMPTVTSGYDENGSAVVGQSDGAGFSSVKRRNPNGAGEGDYSVNGYVITLRFDNGAVVRMPFFFRDASRKEIWFEGDILSTEVGD